MRRFSCLPETNRCTFRIVEQKGRLIRSFPEKMMVIKAVLDHRFKTAFCVVCEGAFGIAPTVLKCANGVKQ